MGDIAPSKMPKGVRKARRDDTDFTEYAKGGKVGLYANINAKRKRIAKGSGEKCASLIQKVLQPLKRLLNQQKPPGGNNG
jgi:predicted AlkP superfamily phosphohydrolase/phosphomutase